MFKLITLSTLILASCCRWPQSDYFDCSESATVEQVICGSGNWGSLWIKLDNGTILRPWKSVTSDIQLLANDRVKLSYRYENQPAGTDTSIICMAVPPDHKDVVITCISIYKND